MRLQKLNVLHQTVDEIEDRDGVKGRHLLPVGL